MNKLVLVLVLGTGCAKTDSGDLLTSGIYADVSAITQGSGTTTVNATLFVGSPLNLNFVELTGNDQLVATHGSDRKVMVESQLLNIVGHSADFPVDAEGEMFDIAFDRTVDQGAPRSTATLPAKFTVAPPPSTSSRAAMLTVGWSPSGSGDAMSFRAEGDCIESFVDSLAGDAGTLAIAANTLKKRQGTNIADQCTATLTVFRTRAGSLDPHYGKGGTVSGIQARVVTFTTTP
ncbi:MAG: hypothetical protein JWO36_4545 [Myxococcales bacterium]|nr:hypothetical protein [Myxococcales bacterium]